MTRNEKIEEAFQDFLGSDGYDRLQPNSWYAFKAGAEWADQNIKELLNSIEEAYKDYLGSDGMIQATQWSAFKAGVKWVDENKKEIWHDATSEEPQGEYEIMCQDEFEHVWLTCYQKDIKDYKNGWEECVACECIVRWAYIDDLLPKGGNV